MKGMNATLVMNNIATRHTAKLHTLLHSACTDHGVPVPEITDVVKRGLDLFKFNNTGDFVSPLGEYASINDYVKSHLVDSVQAEEVNDLTKDELYDQLVKAATLGRMVKYRRLRKQYTIAS